MVDRGLGPTNGPLAAPQGRADPASMDRYLVTHFLRRAGCRQRAKTGPFQYAVLTGYQVADHYDIHCTAAIKLLDRLSARRVQAALSLWIMDPALRSKKPGEAMALYLAKTPATLHDEATLEALSRPLSRFQIAGGSAETEALVLADFHGRTGLFVRPILVARDLVEFYGAQHFPTVRIAGTMLGEISFRAQTAQARGSSISLHVVHDDPELMAMTPRDLLNEYRAAAGLPAIIARRGRAGPHQRSGAAT